MTLCPPHIFHLPHFPLALFEVELSKEQVLSMSSGRAQLLLGGEARSKALVSHTARHREPGQAGQYTKQSLFKFCNIQKLRFHVD